MPRKKARRVAREQPPLVKAAAPLAGKPVVLGRPPTVAAVLAKAPAPPPQSQPIAPPASNANASDVLPAERMFWACYNAGVDSVRLAFDVQSAFVRQMLQVSPVALALQVHDAFHDRALA